jgi:hypothetical protein
VGVGGVASSFGRGCRVSKSSGTKGCRCRAMAMTCYFSLWRDRTNMATPHRHTWSPNACIHRLCFILMYMICANVANMQQSAVLTKHPNAKL